MIVLDASAVVELLLRSASARPLVDRMASEDASLHAPQFLGVEVVHVLRRLDAQARLPPGRAEEALGALLALDVTRHDHEPLLPRVWGLRHNLTAYDAVYVALAEALRAPLVTLDARLARVPGVRATVQVL